MRNCTNEIHQPLTPSPWWKEDSIAIDDLQLSAEVKDAMRTVFGKRLRPLYTMLTRGAYSFADQLVQLRIAEKLSIEEREDFIRSALLQDKMRCHGLVRRATKLAMAELPLSQLGAYARRGLIEDALCDALVERGDAIAWDSDITSPEVFENLLWPAVYAHLAAKLGVARKIDDDKFLQWASSVGATPIHTPDGRIYWHRIT